MDDLALVFQGKRNLTRDVGAADGVAVQRLAFLLGGLWRLRHSAGPAAECADQPLHQPYDPRENHYPEKETYDASQKPHAAFDSLSGGLLWLSPPRQAGRATFWCAL